MIRGDPPPDPARRPAPTSPKMQVGRQAAAQKPQIPLKPAFERPGGFVHKVETRGVPSDLLDMGG